MQMPSILGRVAVSPKIKKPRATGIITDILLKMAVMATPAYCVESANK